ncbi:serine/threonine protein kinase [Tautonia rosea]|uniref:serine/threonine protein kinase n=1 Tax=Tautonia rosea TaxID=2728037 RepID=UPI001472CCC9|nr:serine/threonine-protein kinase [Tautonia rosea]
MSEGSPKRPPTENVSDSSTTRFRELREHWQREGQSPSVLIRLVKTDLQRRFDLGERPAVRAYLDAIPVLRDDSNWVLSLVYEEYCLLQEVGEAPSPDSFCNRYESWRDSLISQLNYHQLLSQAAGGMPRLPRFPEPGEYFMKYHLRSILGQGGAARVFLAEDDKLGGRPTALKISANRGEEPSIMARLKHRNIMEVLNVDFDEESGLRGLCMPYLPGLPLDQILDRMCATRPEDRTAQTLLDAIAPEGHSIGLDQPAWTDFPTEAYVDACLWLAAQLADALAHAHDRDVLHRDVKPANVLISCSDGPQLIDFNLAHDPHTPERAESALRGGTLPYMAPEQLRAFLDPIQWDSVGPTADVYALGLVLRELLIGTRPEAPPANVPLPRTINELLDVRFAGWPSTRIENPKVPYALDAILARCLAFEPSDRYPSAKALAEDLRALLRRQPLVYERNPSLRERLNFWLHRNRRNLTASASAALILFCGIGIAGAAKSFSGVDHFERGLVFYNRSLSPANIEQADELLEDAKVEFLTVVQGEARTLEDRSNHLRSYHALAVIAKEEGDLATHNQMLTQAIHLYQALDQTDVSILGHEDWLEEFCTYVTNLYVQKVLEANAKFERLLSNKLIHSEEAHQQVIELLKLEPEIELGLSYSKKASPEIRIRMHWATAFAYDTILTQRVSPDVRKHYSQRFQTITAQALDLIEKEGSQSEVRKYETEFIQLRNERDSWDQRKMSSE